MQAALPRLHNILSRLKRYKNYFIKCAFQSKAGAPAKHLGVFTSGHVTRWRSHSSICHRGTPHSARKLRCYMFYRTGVINDGNFTLWEW